MENTVFAAYTPESIQMNLLFLLVSCSTLITANKQPQQEAYPIYEQDKTPALEYRTRRATLKQKIGAGNYALFFTNPEHQRNNDVDFQFRPESNFYYLTGFEEPGAALLLAPDGIEVNGKKSTEVLFCKSRNPGAETWTGVIMGPERAPSVTGIETCVSVDSFASVLAAIKSGSVTTAGVPEGATNELKAMESVWDAWMKANDGTVKVSRAYGRALGSMREIKSDVEIRLLKKAIDNSVLGHIEAMRACEPGITEYQIAAIVEYMFKRNGSEYVGYPCIVGSGANSCILHYESNRKTTQAGEIICMDCGAEYHGYSADVTRSFPVNGKFSAPQKAIYELVLKAQDAGIAACIAGKPFGSADRVARQIIGDGLVALGIIKEARESSRYFMHGTSHHIGLDVHDLSSSGTLHANMVLTVEPGIYIKPGSPCDKKWWGIGVRIEDDIQITPKGPVNMSAGAPRTVSAIEKLMAETGIGNIVAKPYKG